MSDHQLHKIRRIEAAEQDVGAGLKIVKRTLTNRADGMWRKHRCPLKKRNRDLFALRVDQKTSANAFDQKVLVPVGGLLFDKYFAAGRGQELHSAPDFGIGGGRHGEDGLDAVAEGVF